MNRPRVHLTPLQGWLNDPHGICWTGSQYHLFYQHNPAAPAWTREVGWGHAVSSDLVRWRHRPMALTPREGEGCWSGAVVVEDGRPTILYTSVTGDDPDRGRIAVALPDDEAARWHCLDNNVIVDGPPVEIGAIAFRDPCLLATEGGWTMVVGGAASDGRGVVVQYSSADARTWTFDGEVCSRPDSETDGVRTGTLWECPQLFQVLDDWVLLISVGDGRGALYVAAALGSYDGNRFVPERWTRLTHDDAAYAMTAFADSAGRPCVLSWIREDPDHRPETRPWSGALSLPMTVEVTPDRRVRLSPHPDVDTLRDGPPRLDCTLTEKPRRLVAAMDGLDIELSADQGGWFRVGLVDSTGEKLVVTGAGSQAGMASGTRGSSLLVSRPDRQAARVPVTSGPFRLVVDRGLVEVFGGDGSATFRVASDDADLVVTGSPVSASSPTGWWGSSSEDSATRCRRGSQPSTTATSRARSQPQPAGRGRCPDRASRRRCVCRDLAPARRRFVGRPPRSARGTSGSGRQGRRPSKDPSDRASPPSSSARVRYRSVCTRLAVEDRHHEAIVARSRNPS